jgi:phosphoglycolate phosphatase
VTRRYDLIIFDWDGTLMDSETKIVRCFQAAASDAGARYPGDDAIRNVIGLGLMEAIDDVFTHEAPATRELVLQGYRDHFLVHDNTEMPLFPGVVEGLKQLRARGHQLAVATGKARRGLDRVFREVAISHLFHSTRCADETRSKPHPQMLEEILTETGVAPGRAIMVGDSVFDMEMARNAGIDALAVSYGVQPCDALQRYAPVACAANFDEVCAWL